MASYKGVFLSLLKVGSSSKSRAAVLPDKRAASVLEGKTFCASEK